MKIVMRNKATGQTISTIAERFPAAYADAAVSGINAVWENDRAVFAWEEEK